MKTASRCLLIIAFCILGATGLQAANIQSYAGKIDGTNCEFAIIWHDNGDVSGLLDYQGRRISLSGENPLQGVLIFIDSDGDTYYLRKTMTANAIIWSGTMNGGARVYLARLR